MKPSINRFHTFFADLARAKRARDAYMRLDAMSDASLAALGLQRGELVARAFEESAGK